MERIGDERDAYRGARRPRGGEPSALRLAARYGGRALAAGAAAMAVGTGWTLLAAHGSAAAWPLVGGLVVSGVGLGQISVPLVNLALSAVAPRWGGAAAGVFATSQQFGSALGAAVVGGVYFAHAGAGATAALVSTGPWLIGGFVVTAVLTVLLPRPRNA